MNHTSGLMPRDLWDFVDHTASHEDLHHSCHQYNVAKTGFRCIEQCALSDAQKILQVNGFSFFIFNWIPITSLLSLERFPINIFIGFLPLVFNKHLCTFSLGFTASTKNNGQKGQETVFDVQMTHYN